MKTALLTFSESITTLTQILFGGVLLLFKTDTAITSEEAEDIFKNPKDKQKIDKEVNDMLKNNNKEGRDIDLSNNRKITIYVQ